MDVKTRELMGRSVRFFWDEELNEWKYSAVDVIGALAMSEEKEVYFEIFRKRNAYVSKLEKRVLEGEKLEEVAAAEQLVKLSSAFAPEERKALREFIAGISSGFDEVYAPLVEMDGNMLRANGTLHPAEKTIWLTAEDIAILFELEKKRVVECAESIISSGERAEDGSVMNVISESGSLRFYSLEMVIAIALRSESLVSLRLRRGLEKLASRFVVKGYAYDKLRLENLGLELEVRNVSDISFSEPDAFDAVEFIECFFSQKKGEEHFNLYRITAETCMEILEIGKVKTDETLLEKLADVLSAVYRDDGGSAEEKAARLLYLLVKSGIPKPDMIFLYFLYANGIAFAGKRTSITPAELELMLALVSGSDDQNRCVSLISSSLLRPA